MKSEAVSLTEGRLRVADFLALTKPRLNSLVVFSAGVGYFLGAGGQVDLSTLLHTVVGATLVAFGAASLNQAAERDIDEVMIRTRKRPLPSGRVQPAEARIFGTLLATLGMVQLAIAASPTAALVSLATLMSYVFLYTPLKRRTPWATLVGAVPGALPPVIGWAAAQGRLGVEAAALFAIVFLWQLPHFHALAWMYRDDFARAKLPLLAVLHPDGRRNAAHALWYTAALVPVSLLPYAMGMTGGLYAGAALTLGATFVLLAWRFRATPTDGRARTLFRASLVYLPVLWALLVFDGVF